MKKFSILFISLLIHQAAIAQFIINENFKSKSATSVIKFGGVADLTGGKVDPDGDGWLRLTPAVANQKGYAFIDQSFPSALGIIAEFEFKAWRSTQSSSYTGGDGFSVFLFDGSVSSSSFRIGGYGGSLGYSRNTATSPAVPNGLLGGFIGIGFDSYGNYGNIGEGKSGIISTGVAIPKDTNNSDGTIPNTIVLRGATNETTATSSNQILGYAKLGDRTGTGNAMRILSELDYDVLTATRPTDTQFYRKVRIEVTPIAGSTVKYQIKVFMTKSANTDYSTTPYINYTTTETIPSTLKIGFAGSTGGAYNNHEIRNLQITTTGNLSVFNSVDNPLICSDVQSKDVTFKISVNNANDVTINSILVNSNFLDKVNGSLIDKNLFSVNSITYSSNISNSTIQNNGNNIKGTISLPANQVGTIYVNGTINKPNIQVVNTVDVSASEITDQDLSNNTSTETVKRYICKVTTNPVLYIKSK
jgi:hypothetical protein